MANKPPTLAELMADDIVDLKRAASLVHVHRRTLIAHIRKGNLKAFFPAGKTAVNPGRSMGYRIRIGDLSAWYFGQSGE